MTLITLRKERVNDYCSGVDDDDDDGDVNEYGGDGNGDNDDSGDDDDDDSNNGDHDHGGDRLHAVLFFSLLVIERLERARCATARETVPLARSSPSITVGEKRKGLRAVYDGDDDRHGCGCGCGGGLILCS